MLYKSASVGSSDAFSVSDIERLLKRSKLPIDGNFIATNVMVHSWYYVTMDLCPHVCDVLHEWLSWDTLPNVISTCVKMSDMLISALDTQDTITDNTILTYVNIAYLGICKAYLVNFVNINVDIYDLYILHDLLQVLRYAKRFSLPNNPDVQDASIEKFWAVNNRHKNRDYICHTWYYHECIKVVQKHLKHVLKGYKYNLDDRMFSNGVAVDAKRHLGSKLSAYAKKRSTYWDSLLYPCSESGEMIDCMHCRIVAVPKTYDKSRIIAEEPVVRQFYMQAVRCAITRCFKRNNIPIFLEDQTVNQREAYLASINNNMVTIDLSGASDSISRSFATEVLPADVMRDVRLYWSTFIQPAKGRDNLCYIFLTSGNAATFALESAIFYSIVRAAYDEYALWTGKRATEVVVYGDDMIVDSDAYEFVLRYLTMFGFVVNKTKTYVSGYYRESCGVEYFKGRALDTLYFPRRTLRQVESAKRLLLDPDSLAAVISLQHRLYWASPSARRWLTQFVIAQFPRMTYHDPDTDCDDLWGVGYKVQLAKSKACADCTALHPEWAMREAHYMLQTIPASDKQLGQNKLLDMWYYTQYLKEGPQNDVLIMNRLSEGYSGLEMPVTRSRCKYAHDSVGTKTVWRLCVE